MREAVRNTIPAQIYPRWEVYISKDTATSEDNERYKQMEKLSSRFDGRLDPETPLAVIAYFLNYSDDLLGEHFEAFRTELPSNHMNAWTVDDFHQYTTKDRADWRFSWTTRIGAQHRELRDRIKGQSSEEMDEIVQSATINKTIDIIK